MTSDDIKSLIDKDKAVGYLVLASILIPTIWALASIYYSGQINSQKGSIEILKESKNFLELRLRDCSESKQQLSESITKLSASRINSKPDSIASHIEKEPGEFPVIKNTRALTKLEVSDLADFYELTKKWNVNPQLQFDTGDISYWYGRRLDEDELKKQFEARRLILERAEKSGRVIPTKGDLSALAEQIMIDY